VTKRRMSSWYRWNRRARARPSRGAVPCRNKLAVIPSAAAAW
jgi:hypothetical protein